jgi:hypothetical protein
MSKLNKERELIEKIMSLEHYKEEIQWYEDMLMGKCRFAGVNIPQNLLPYKSERKQIEVMEKSIKFCKDKMIELKKEIKEAQKIVTSEED